MLVSFAQYENKKKMKKIDKETKYKLHKAMSIASSALSLMRALSGNNHKTYEEKLICDMRDELALDNPDQRIIEEYAKQIENNVNLL